MQEKNVMRHVEAFHQQSLQNCMLKLVDYYKNNELHNVISYPHFSKVVKATPAVTCIKKPAEKKPKYNPELSVNDPTMQSAGMNDPSMQSAGNYICTISSHHFYLCGRNIHCKLCPGGANITPLNCPRCQETAVTIEKIRNADTAVRRKLVEGSGTIELCWPPCEVFSKNLLWENIGKRWNQSNVDWINYLNASKDFGAFEI
jgi:hypothetical protein